MFPFPFVGRKSRRSPAKPRHQALRHQPRARRLHHEPLEERTLLSVWLDDDFNDGVLDPTWDVALNNATEWDYAETGTELTVDDIAGPGTGWRSVWLTRPSDTPLDDFDMSATFSWEQSGNEVLQSLFFDVLAEDLVEQSNKLVEVVALASADVEHSARARQARSTKARPFRSRFLDLLLCAFCVL